MINKFHLAIFSLLICISSSSVAEKDLMVTKLGTLSCGQILSSLNTDFGKVEIADWLNGYVAGYNYYNAEHRVTPPDNETNIAFIDSYCKQNPLSNILAGGAELVGELGGK